MKLAHQRLRLAAHSRSLLVPVVAATFLLVGAFFPGPTDPYEAWSFCAVFTSALCFWLVYAIERAVPPQADSMLIARHGGARASRAANAILIAELALLVAAVFIAVPIALGVVSPVPPGEDLVSAVFGLGLSAAFGGVLALSIGKSTRSGMAFVVIIGVLLALAGLVTLIPDLAGPFGVGQKLSRLDDIRHGSAVPAIALSAVYVTALFGAAQRLERWRG